MKKLLSVVLVSVILFAAGVACTPASKPVPSYFACLDSLLERRDDFERAKQQRIENLKQKEKSAVSSTDRYLYASLIFDEYAIYNADSAMKYINRRLDIARSCHNRDWETHSLIAKAGLLAGTGLLYEAENILKGIDTTGFSDELLIEYYGQMVYLLSHFGNYAGGRGHDYYERERDYKDSIMAIITPEHPMYLWYRGSDLVGTEKDDPNIIPALREKLDASNLDQRQDAMFAFILSRLYDQQGDAELARKYMAISAMADVKIANAEIASLEDLARTVFKEASEDSDDSDDIDRAYRYVNYSLDKAISYPNRVRAVSMASLLEAVSKAYQQQSLRQQTRTRMSLVVVCVLVVILFSAVAVIIIQNRRLRRQGSRLDKANKSLNANLDELNEAQRQLNDINSRLKLLNEDLKQKNEELNEANYVKEEYIGYIFTMCSKYIRRLDELRRSIHVKAVAKKYNDIIRETGGSDMDRDDLKEFYHSFDTVFLHIYPDFVNDFNSLLQEDKKITPKEGELLNTELRIYALVRLGITDSIKIAEFLHCSPQTVYNNRFRVRNKAIVPKKDFADAVRTLGKFMDRPS